MLEKKEKDLQEINSAIDYCNTQVEAAKNEINKLTEELKNLPAINKIELRRERLKKEKENKEKTLKDKYKKKQELIFEYTIMIMLWPAIKKSLEIIKEKKDKKEIPPTINKKLLEESLEKNICEICGRKLDDHGKKAIKQLLEEITESTIISQELLRIENPLVTFSRKITEFETRIRTITKEIQKDEQEIEEIEKSLQNIDKILIGYDAEKIRGLYGQLQKIEKAYEKTLIRLGTLKYQKENLEKEIQNLEKKKNEELKKEKRFKQLRRQIEFCTQALTILKKAKEEIMEDIRREIEEKTREFFFDMVWKKETFKSLEIDENYNISLIHSMGFDCLGSLSGGEREVLTLAFTMALHQVSGFDSPIVIDRPLAMVSGPPRTKIVKILSEISKNKQVILFFTPDDYSEDVSRILDDQLSTLYKLEMTPDEGETRIEGG